MKYIKKINEFFDSPEIKSQLEVPYLQGKIPFKEVVKDKNLLEEGDLLLSKLIMNCPYISGLNYRRLSNNLINIGFQEGTDDVLTYFSIEIVEHKSVGSISKYLCNIYAKCIESNKVLFDEKINKSLMSYDQLISLINKEGLDLLIKFTRFVNSKYDSDILINLDRNYLNNKNVGRN
jgi:hypothetical protein